MDNKVCNTCKKAKPKSEFYSYKNSKDKLTYDCKACVLEKCKKYRDENPDKIKAINKRCYQQKREHRIKKQREYWQNNKDKINDYKKNWLARNPDYSKRNDLKRKYNLTLEEFDLMMKFQNNQCLTCGKDFTKRSDAHVDHCHKTQKIRGLLCSHCNTAIGLVYERKETLSNMINYLEQNA